MVKGGELQTAGTRRGMLNAFTTCAGSYTAISNGGRSAGGKIGTLAVLATACDASQFEAVAGGTGALSASSRAVWHGAITELRIAGCAALVKQPYAAPAVWHNSSRAAVSSATTVREDRDNLMPRMFKGMESGRRGGKVLRGREMLRSIN